MMGPPFKCPSCSADGSKIRHLAYEKRFGRGWKKIPGFYCLGCGKVYYLTVYKEGDHIEDVLDKMFEKKQRLSRPNF